MTREQFHTWLIGHMHLIHRAKDGVLTDDELQALDHACDVFSPAPPSETP